MNSGWMQDFLSGVANGAQCKIEKIRICKKMLQNVTLSQITKVCVLIFNVVSGQIQHLTRFLIHIPNDQLVSK